MTTNYIHDADAVLDYGFDWKASTNGTGTSDWLATGETISSYVVTVPAGITLDSDSESDGLVTVWVSGATAGDNYRVSCRITTSAGRTDERSITLYAKER